VSGPFGPINRLGRARDRPISHYVTDIQFASEVFRPAGHVIVLLVWLCMRVEMRRETGLIATASARAELVAFPAEGGGEQPFHFADGERDQP
jgi:hypothetical protein